MLIVTLNMCKDKVFLQCWSVKGMFFHSPWKWSHASSTWDVSVNDSRLAVLSLILSQVYVRCIPSLTAKWFLFFFPSFPDSGVCGVYGKGLQWLVSFDLAGQFYYEALPYSAWKPGIWGTPIWNCWWSCNLCCIWMVWREIGELQTDELDCSSFFLKEALEMISLQKMLTKITLHWSKYFCVLKISWSIGSKRTIEVLTEPGNIGRLLRMLNENRCRRK